jgi:hypothetical protein
MLLPSQSALPPCRLVSPQGQMLPIRQSLYVSYHAGVTDETMGLQESKDIRTIILSTQ